MINSVICEGREFKPSKVVCIGRNYAEHITELNNEVPDVPVIFCKPNSAIASELRAGADGELHYESELAFLVENGALVAVGFGLDLTKRELQSTLKTKGLPWERAKAFDGAAVFSQFVRMGADVSNLCLQLDLNGLRVQEGGYSLMLHKPADLVAEVSAFMRLEDGDILMTGTPKGVGPFSRGDEFSGRVLDADRVIVEQNWRAK